MKRSNKRYTYAVEIYNTQGQLLGSTSNISEEGIFLETPLFNDDLNEQLIFSVVIRATDKTKWPIIKALAEIKWKKYKPDGELHGYGIQVFPANPLAMNELIGHIENNLNRIDHKRSA